MTSLREDADPDGPEAFAGTLMDGLQDEPGSLFQFLRERVTCLRKGHDWVRWPLGVAEGCARCGALRWPE